MHLLDAYMTQASRHNWKVSLKGFAAFVDQIKQDYRKANGQWNWEGEVWTDTPTPT